MTADPPAHEEHPQLRPLRDPQEAWGFFGEIIRNERTQLAAIAQRSLRSHGMISSFTEGDDLVHDAVAHLVRHVELGTREIYPRGGILVHQIRLRAGHLAQRAGRRATYADGIGDRVGDFDRSHNSESLEETATTRVHVAEISRSRSDLIDRIQILARADGITRDGWEALRAVEISSDSPTPPSIRKRASRTRGAIWPVIDEWRQALGASPSASDHNANRLSTILHGTGLIELTWGDLNEP